MKDNHLIHQLSLELEKDFGGMDFWQLSKFWKRQHYKSVAKRLIWIIRENDKFEEEQNE